MKFKIYLILVVIGFVLSNKSYGMNIGYVYSINNSIPSSDISVQIQSLKESVQTCGPEQDFKIILKNNSTTNYKTLNGILFKLNLPSSYSLTNSILVKNNGVDVTGNFSIKGLDSIRLDANFNMAPNSTIEVSFGATISCNYNLNETISLTTYYNNETNQTLIANNNVNSQFTVNYTSSNYQVINFVKNQTVNRFVEIERPITFKDLNYQVGNRVNKLKLLYTYPVVNVQLLKLKVKKLDGTYLEIPYDNTTNSPLIEQGSVVYTTSSFIIDASLLNTDFISETIEMQLMYKYVGCDPSNVSYDLNQFCANGTVCTFKSNGAYTNENISINSALPTFDITYLPEKSKKADDCNRSGKIRYKFTNTSTQNVNGYYFNPWFGGRGNDIEYDDIYYVYIDNLGNEQYYKWNGNLSNDLDGNGVGLDLINDPTSANKINFLAPGKSIEIEYRYNLLDLCREGVNKNASYSLHIDAEFHDVCYKVSTPNLINKWFSSSEYINGRDIVAPSDIIENTTTSIYYTPGYSIFTNGEDGLLENCTSRNYEVKFKIPGNATIENVKYNNLIVSSNNLSYITEVGVNYLIIKQSASNVGNNGTYEIQLKSTDCSTATSQNLEFELFTSCGTSSCKRSLCKVSKLTYFHSDQCGTSACFNTKSFSFKRSTFGWKVTRPVTNNMYYASDLDVRATENDGVDTSKVYTDDYIKFHLNGIASSKCGDNLVAKLKYTSDTSLFDVISGQFLIKNATTGTILYTLNVNSSQITFGVEGIYQTILFTAPLTNISSLNNVILDFQSDLHVKVNVPTGKYILEDVRGEFLFKNQDFIYGKDSWGKRFTVLSEINQYYSNSFFSLDACKNKVVLGIESSSTGNFGEIDFVNEFRPVSHFIDEQTITIPTDFEYVPQSIKLGLMNKNYQSHLYINDVINYYPSNQYSVIENYNPITRILKIKINNSPLLLNDNKTILVCAFDIKSSNCVTSNNTNNDMLINFSRRDYAFVDKTSIQPNTSYKQSGAAKYTTYLSNINISFKSNANYSKTYDKVKVSWDYKDSIKVKNSSSRPLANFWIAFENNLPVNLKFANVKIGQNVGTISNYGENDKYTFVNFGILPYDNSYNALTFDVATDECSSIPQDIKELPFKMYMGTSCSSKQYSRAGSDCQILPIDFKIRIQNDFAELNKMVLANSNYEQLTTITPNQICDDVYYLGQISNSSLSTYVYDNVAVINYPDGMEIKEVQYQYGNLSNTQIPYEVINKNQIKIDLSANIDSIRHGFKSENNVNNPIKIKLKFKTNCNFSPSDNKVDLVYSFTKYCGERVSLENFDDKLQISGFENLNKIKLSLTSTNIEPIKSVLGNGKVSIIVKNIGEIPSDSSKINLTLPSDLKFVSTQNGNLITSNVSTNLTYSIPALSAGETSAILFTVNDYKGDKAKEGIRPSACINESISMTKSIVTSCSNTCDLTAELGKNKICIPLPPKDTIPKEISCEDCIESFAPYQGSKYVLSAWVKEDIIQNGLTTYSGPAIVLRFKLQENDFSLNPMYGTGEIIDGWQRIYQEFTIPSDAQNISVDLINNGNNEVFFDDIRIHPFEANMKSFVYDPVSMKLVAELDENNYATFYEYDEEGALVRVKKETQKGVMTIKESRNNTIKK